MNDWIAVSRTYAELNTKRRPTHCVYLNIKRTKVVEDVEMEKKEETPSVLKIEGQAADKYTFTYGILVLPSEAYIPLPNPDLPWKVQQAVDAIIKVDSAEKKIEIKQWVDDSKPIESQLAKDLVQLDNGVKLSMGNWKCDVCGGDATTNLWLNLTDGHVGCGRQNWDGSGGKGHALEHYRQTNYPLVVKLGTITAEGADVHSYAEDREVLDPHLDAHLKHWGLDMKSLEKTDKTMAELEIEFQMTYDWSRSAESNQVLTPVYGPGYTGLQNMGNTCYMNSVLQTLTKVPSFSDYYIRNRDQFINTSESPATDLRVQLCKLISALESGEYSKEPQEGSEETSSGVKPSMFKSLIGKGHQEFATNRQQDAVEFLEHLFTVIEKVEKRDDPSKVFEFLLEERIQCTRTNEVAYTNHRHKFLSLPIPVEHCVNPGEVAKYEAEQAEKKKAEEAAGVNQASAKKVEQEPEPVRPIIPLSACITTLFTPEISSEFSTSVNENTKCIKSKKLSTFPEYLVLHLGRFTFSGGQLKKLDVFLDVPDELDLEEYRGKGAQPGESLMPPRAKSSGGSGGGGGGQPALKPDPTIIQGMLEFGIPQVRAERAWFNTRAQGTVEAAIEWLFSNSDDPTLDTPLPSEPAPPAPSSGGGGGGGGVDEVALAGLLSMGFPAKKAERALKETKNNLEAATDWLFSHMEDDDVEIEEPQVAVAPVEEVVEEVPPLDGSGKYKLWAFVTHMGTSTASGHYVAHILVDGKWIIYNDGKVAESQEPPRKLAYLYFYKRQ